MTTDDERDMEALWHWADSETARADAAEAEVERLTERVDWEEHLLERVERAEKALREARAAELRRAALEIDLEVVGWSNGARMVRRIDVIRWLQDEAIRIGGDA